MSLPPRDELARLLLALSDRLPEQLGPGLRHARFVGALPALERLGDGDHVARAVAQLDDAQVASVTQDLRTLWARIGEVELPPACAIPGPHDHWLAAGRLQVQVEVQVDGLEPGWSVTWRGAEGDDSTAVLELGAGDEAVVHARVEGRAAGDRTLVVATARLRGRVPYVHVAGPVLHIRDEAGRPAAHVAVRVGEDAGRTDATGRLELGVAPPAGAPIDVEGVVARRTDTD